ncbi:hypothetical protein [Paracoccus sp. (in: a-proteobacteria)]|uniref:hypothetical protein n=1 Tax=Paracoccus sp. TaxID=267 RepID=UPI0026E056C6|nr:hypothetical protein [Paracoccus sp. (in: a-proteobacteria)]MDO5647340.1 hypothetical protein [Paracoccus sp. (in: a-proteobacteria)]
MNRTEFITAAALILFGAFVLGWIASWLIHRISRPTRANMSELDELAQQLHNTEEERDEAINQITRLRSEIAQREAEARAAMDGLRDSRSEIEELRDYIEQKLNRR